MTSGLTNGRKRSEANWLNRIKNLDCNFSEKLTQAIESGKLPVFNNLLFTSYEISEEQYEELRKNHQLTNGNSLSSIDLLAPSNGETDLINGLTNGKDHEINDSVYQNGHSTYQNGHTTTTNNHHNDDEEEEEINNEDSINNQMSSLETDNVQNGDALNESIELESNNDNL